jgi:ribose 5-phosphate isomerase B
MKKIWMGNDHGGYEMKLQLIEHLKNSAYEVNDVGSFSTEIVRYPYFARKVAMAISKGEAERGILICSTGIGMSIIANKFKGIRASVCTSTYMGRMTRAHNNSNILCLGGKITGIFEAIDILDTWLTTPFEGGRHNISLGLIDEAENAIINPDGWTPKDIEK